MWGSPPIEIPEEAHARWGARAILERGRLSTLPDRRGWDAERGVDLLLHRSLGRWLPVLKEHAEQMDPGGSEVFSLDNNGMHLRATCNGSHGYVYIAAWSDWPFVRPDFDTVEEAIHGDDVGFCLACGNEQGGCEPDARDYVCEVCGAPRVYGAEEIVMQSFCKE